ncbi:helix-turn-helix domain-containing protein [Cryptosporangium minutisporangium]|uniref:HTH cro/C1-type domain-containing protein n=1 Tax=Cryptosporangium minutisporangium TaxID=113569 RepID=A0ABP6SUI8_9ACTN
MDHDVTTTPVTQVTATMDAFRTELTRRRVEAGLSKKALARRMSFDPSYVSHIESGRHRPTEDFARRADDVLGSGGRLWLLWREYDRSRQESAAGAAVPVTPTADSSSDLVVEREEASMRFDGHSYVMTIRRQLHNVGTKPVSLYWIRIVSDDRSEAPLTWDMIDLRASCNGEPMDWRVASDQPFAKHVWLQFRHGDYEFPLYPGDRTWIEYSYTVAEGIWGHWFQRAIRLPTRYLSIRLTFPTHLEPRVWGTETSMTADGAPLAATPRITHSPDGESEWFWEVPHPQLNARYRLLWQFQNGPGIRSGQAAERSERSERSDRPERADRSDHPGRARRSLLNRRRPAVLQ